MFQQYHASLVGAFFIIITIVAQALIATIAHRRQANCIPGIMNEKLGHESFVFRSYRTHQNSLENIVQMIIPVFLAIFIGVNSTTLAIVVWIYALARLMHMVLYYAIATEKNPSPRSYFYMIGLLSNIYLLVIIAIQLF